MTSNERPTIRSARRRAFLKMAAATGALATVGSVSTAQQSTFVFEGHIGAWEAKAPSEIEGQDNPTLELEAGQNYVVEWTNADGLPHNFVIVNGDGEELVRSDIVEEKGVTQTVEFQATEEMAEYFCEFHPKRMRGQIETGDGDQQEGDEEEIVPEGDSIGLETVAEGLTSPTGFEYAPDGSGRHFVVDQTGQVYVHGEDGLEEEPFLDISNRLVDLGIEFEPELLIECTAEVLDLVDDVGRESLGINLDVGHAAVYGEDVAESIRNSAGHITGVHLEDIVGGRRGKHYHRIPGDGDIDFRGTFGALDDIGYDGYATLELYTYPDEPDRAAERAYDELAGYC